jgi:hypothetical protein
MEKLQKQKKFIILDITFRNDSSSSDILGGRNHRAVERCGGIVEWGE